MIQGGTSMLITIMITPCIVDNNNDNTMYSDAGMMIVPTDEAFTEWWNGNGKELQDEYGTLQNVPNAIIAELVNVNMIPTFSSYVPSSHSFFFL